MGFDQRDAAEPGGTQAKRLGPHITGSTDRAFRNPVGDDLDRGDHFTGPDALPAGNGGQGDHRVDGVQRIHPVGIDLDHAGRAGVQVDAARAHRAEVNARNLRVGDKSPGNGKGCWVFMQVFRVQTGGNDRGPARRLKQSDLARAKSAAFAKAAVGQGDGMGQDRAFGL